MLNSLISFLFSWMLLDVEMLLGSIRVLLFKYAFHAPKKPTQTPTISLENKIRCFHSRNG